MNILPIKDVFLILIARAAPTVVSALLGFTLGALFFGTNWNSFQSPFQYDHEDPDAGPDDTCQLDGGAVEAGTVVCGDQMVISIDRSTSIVLTGQNWSLGQNLWTIDRSAPMWIYSALMTKMTTN